MSKGFKQPGKGRDQAATASRNRRRTVQSKRIVSRDEARDFYLQVFDEFAVEVYDKGDKSRGEQTIDNRDKASVVDAINLALKSAGSDQTIVESNVNGEYNVWQCWHTYDDWSREQAEAAFDAAWPTDRTEVAVTVAKARSGAPTTAPAATCRCGCGLQTRKGKGYLPGHDARHAGQVARAILALPGRAGEPNAVDGKAWRALINELPTQALRDKALAQVERGIAKAVAARASVVPNASKPTTAAPAKPKPRRPRRPTGDGPESLKSLLTF